MALITCPECGNQISDKAAVCIHCGYPLSEYKEVTVIEAEKSNIKSVEEKQLDIAFSLLEEKKYKEALELYIELALEGNSDARLWVGNFYDRGLGVATNKEKARYWFKLASEQNHPSACFNLAMLEKRGSQFPDNVEYVVSLLKKSSDLGNDSASYELGLMYNMGYGIEQNYEKAAYYYDISYKQGNRSSTLHNNLAVLYMDGKGVEKDYNKALNLLRIAIKDESNIQAKNNLSELNKRMGISSTPAGYKCPSCGKMTGYKISHTSKITSVGFWGIASNKLGKTYKCKNCGYIW